VIEPYSSTAVLPFDPHGWLHHVNERNLRRIIQTYVPTTIVELGAWLGETTRFLAREAPKGATVYAVDHFLGGPDIAHIPEVPPRLPTLYQQFISNIRHSGLCDRIVPVRMDTQEAARALGPTPDLVYMDACMFESSFLPDVKAWWARLADGGVLCGDDWLFFPDVPRVLGQLQDELGLVVHNDDNFWWCDPKRGPQEARA
jgi:predicted O-methyltransferase YrrM